MVRSNFSSRIRPERVPDRPVRAVASILVGIILIAAGIMLAFRNPGTSRRESPNLAPTLAPSPSPPVSASVASAAAAKSPGPRQPVATDPGELGQTLEDFQAEYESLAAKAGGQEAFFKNAVGKKVVWKVRVDHVFRTGAGVIVVFSSTDRPDWAAYPVSDARFPARLEKQLMTLSRGDVIRVEGKLVYRGIKTLECSDFEMVRRDTPSP